MTHRPKTAARRCGAILLALPLTCLANVDNAAAPLRIDGIADEAAWQQARVFSDFVVTQPYTLAAPTHATEVRMLSTAQGLAFFFRCSQPAGTPRQRERTPRDADAPGDRVNVFIDFNADGEVAYNFTVSLSGAIQDGTLTNENNYSPDWDADWQHAVAEDADSWTVEILLPWTIAAMRGSDAATRTVALMFDRVLGSSAERSGSPAASFNRPRFVSEFRRVEVDQYSSAVLDWFPYATVQQDLVGERSVGKAGLDVFWKPSGDFQLTAALNPDFGQVEADELVVNFDAVETFFSDRRAFFTENQSLFDLRTPDNGQLIYTRRIGGPRDDDSGLAADIDAALKLNGSARGFDYGVLAALEAEHAADLGSLFFAQRLLHPGSTLSLGYLGTWTERPFFDRRAMVNALDATWRPNGYLQLSAQLIGSDTRQAGAGAQDHGEWFRLDLTPSPALRHELEVTHFGAALDFNDMGFQRRASLNELEWTTQFQQSGFAADHWLRGISWSGELQYRSNDDGDRLPVVGIPEINLQLRNGAELTVDGFFESAGYDDLITRGNGLLRRAQRRYFGATFGTPRIGAMQYEFYAGSFDEGVADHAWNTSAEVAWFASDTLNLGAELTWLDSPDWLIWERDSLLASYRRTMATASLDANWFPGGGHELRLKTQWLAIDARDPRALRIGARGWLRESGEALDDFQINNFGVQLRYRWTFAPQSDLFVVYSRGGFSERSGPGPGVGDLFGDAFSLRDSDQVLVKVRYRL